MIPLIVVGGPTASGKTALAVKIAGKVGGEVVSADSMQIYKYMDIGSAKPTKEEMQGVPHHMIDIVEPWQNFSLCDYAKQAHEVIRDIHSRGKIPVMAGGTGLYINTVMNNIKLSDEEETDGRVRKALEEYLIQNGKEALFDRLKKIDPESAENIHPNNTKRVIRAIEIYENTGKTMSHQIADSQKAPKIYKTLQFAVDFEREELYDRINRRVDIMMESGLIEEVRHCVKLGCSRENTSMQAIGYKEVLDYFDGIYDIEETTEIIKQETRRYAKRQLTWFKRNDITWLRPGEMPDLSGFIK